MSSAAPGVAVASLPVTIPSVIDGRYRVDKLLGRGGMAVVCAAHDLVRARRVALKRLLISPDSNKQQRNIELFEREFHMLAQLAHPRIVQVYDFGIDAGGAYYTMELLEGRDLQRLSPMPWRSACAVARDVCSALSLMHSRRIVHRDVSPRNVHCLADGTAKLLDFGVVAPMGSTKILVGTPPCCAPESVNLQQLDGRTDLFGLGATLYFALVGGHAFPATRFKDLTEIWCYGFARPSDLVPDVPKALDELVLDLLRLVPDARPTSAAEVMERLSAIDGALAIEELRTAASYLATPPLVGRETELERVQRRLARAAGERSRSVIIEGAAGVGRTRLLDACLLSATLRGYTVARCDADDAVSGDYGVVRALAKQLFELVPAAARETATPWLASLESILPEAAFARESTLPEPAQVERAQLQQALQAWLAALAERHPFVVAVDDFHRVDEPSGSLLALLEDGDHPGLCLLLSAEAGAPWTAQAAHKLLAPTTSIKLGNLSPSDCQNLLRSLFGDVPNLSLLADRVQTLSSGNPRDLLRLAQHFIDRGLVYYASGAWTLPADIDPGDLPASLAHALHARIESLDEPARRLAWALALCPDRSLSLDDCARLSGEPDRARALAVCERLTAREIARQIEDRLALSQPAWIPLLRATLVPTTEAALERELGQLFEQRDCEEFRAAQHWFRAGEPAHALDLLVEHARSSQEKTAGGSELFAAYLRTLPEGWFQTFEDALAMCDRLDRPHRDKFILLSRLSGIMPMLNLFAPAYTRALFAILERDSGLADWAELAQQPDPKLRLMQALERARRRYETASEHDRVNDVATALPFLVRAVVTASAGVVFSLDLAYLRSWPRLTPLAPLSPAIEVATKLIEGVDARCAGRAPQARRLYIELIERVQRPDRAGMDASHASYIALGVMNGLGMLEAMSGMASCLHWANQISAHPTYAVNAVLIRMLHHVFHGDARAADECRRSAERLRAQNVGRAVYEGQQLIGEVQAYALSGDLTRMRHTRHEIAPLAKRFAAWRPVLRYAKAEYYRLVGDPHSALRQVEQVLELTSAGMHQIWPAAASAHVLVLLDLNRSALAGEVADQYLAAAQRELEHVPERLSLARALARARLGHADAATLADAVIEHMQSAGFGRLHLGVAHETRARIALSFDDRVSFERHEALCSEQFSMQRNAALTAKCHRLAQDGSRAFNEPRASSASTPDSQGTAATTRIDLALASCHDEEQRARLALTFLANQGEASVGCLFSLGEDGPYFAAQVGDVSRPEAWLQAVVEYLAIQSEQAANTSTHTGEDELPRLRWVDANGREYQPVLLCHNDNGTQIITGVAVLANVAGSEFVHPAAAAAAVSRFYAGAGSNSIALTVE
jgi:hypothetical protein